MNKKYILSIDQGTSSCRAIIFNENFQILGIEQKEFPQYYPKTGWVEQNPNEIWSTQLLVIKNLLNKLNINPEDIAAIGITNQRETTVVWDKNTGQPIYNAIVWQDKRTAELCQQIKNSDFGDKIHKKTGLFIDSYFSATKLKWILDNVPQAREKAKKGDLLFGTIDTWLIWNLTGGKQHKTDFSNASRTMIFNIKDLKWDKEILDYFDIPENLLPQVIDSQGILGYTDKNILGAEIPISGVAGDQQAALFGQLCLETGMAKNTYGTGCFILMNTGNEIKYSDNGLLTTIAWGINGKITYAIEGSVFIAGAVIKWLRDGLKIIESATETEQMALSVPDNGDIYFIPAFAGLGAPYWNMHVRGAIVGLTQGITKNHIVRAALEAIAYQTKDVFDAMYKDTNIKLEKLFVDGGATANNFLMQFQADILNVEVVRPENIETTALGAGFLAALGVGFTTIETLKSFKKIDHHFYPQMTDNERNKLYQGWKNTVNMLIANNR